MRNKEENPSYVITRQILLTLQLSSLGSRMPDLAWNSLCAANHKAGSSPSISLQNSRNALRNVVSQRWWVKPKEPKRPDQTVLGISDD